MDAFDPQVIFMDIPNKTHDVLQPEIYDGYRSALSQTTEIRDVYLCIMITYTFFLVELKFCNL